MCIVSARPFVPNQVARVGSAATNAYCTSASVTVFGDCAVFGSPVESPVGPLESPLDVTFGGSSLSLSLGTRYIADHEVGANSCMPSSRLRAFTIACTKL